MRNQDQFRGCFIGGAAGDALGYAVEFIREEQIFKKYGELGITDYDLEYGVARISDDTQMTLFTAAGLLAGTAQDRAKGNTSGWAKAMNASYLDWLRTQDEDDPSDERCASWLGNVGELYHRRAPGNTCLEALRAGGSGTIEKPINCSKGCGAVMRVAPIGLYFNDRGWEPKNIARLGAQAAALTHGHPLGWMPAAALAQIIHEVTQNETPLRDAVLHALNTVDELWPDLKDGMVFTGLMEKAIDLASEDMDDLNAIHALGEGWAGHEALAIAVYCALKYQDDFEKALIASVNHSGDSDSTGAIAGNIVGALAGYSGIPKKFKEHLELQNVILEIADDLWKGRGGMDETVYRQKYVDAVYWIPKMP